mgnify:CR=1 FL=1
MYSNDLPSRRRELTLRIAVTGDAGFIGYHTSARLLADGHQVLGIDALTDYYDPQLKRDRLSRLDAHEAFEHRTGRLEDAAFIGEALQSFRPEIVMHFAAQAGVRYSIEAPEAYISSNVVGTQVLLEALKEIRPAHTLIASTSSAYGGNTVLPFSEQHSTRSPVSLYAATKISGEAIAHSYSHLWDLPVTCFRFFTVYGPWGRPDMALFKFVTAIEKGDPIDIYGFGEMKRDFTYVDDLVSAVTLLMGRPPRSGSPVGAFDTLSPVAPYRVVNIAGGAPLGLLDFVEAVEDATGKKAVRRLLPMQPGDVVETYADTRLLRDLIGSLPETTVRDGVEQFVDWFARYRSTVPQGA